MRYLFLLAAIFFCSKFVNAQGVHFLRYSTKYKYADSFSYTEDDPEKGIYVRITVTAGGIQVWITKKSNNVLNATYNINSTEYDQFLETIKSCNLKKKRAKKSEACKGLFSQRFGVVARKNNIGFKSKVSGERTKCNGYDYTTIQGDLDKFAEVFKQLVPNYEAKIDSIKNSK